MGAVSAFTDRNLSLPTSSGVASFLDGIDCVYISFFMLVKLALHLTSNIDWDLMRRFAFG